MTTDDTTPARWSFAKRFGFRFLFCWLALYLFPFPLDYLPFTSKVWALWTDAWHRLIPWVGARIFHLSQPAVYVRSGSGDKVYDYLFMMTLMLIAALAAVVWSWLDRRRKNYSWLAGWSRVYLRFALASVLLGYGFNKVFDLQFSPPSEYELIQPLGYSSPMSVAWTFMGYSIAYTVFAGALECLGGLLLFFRRTATLGAMVTAVVMINVVMMNFCYDIPVKLHSSLYLLLAILILLPSARRLFDAFILHRPVVPEDIRPPDWKGWRRWGRLSLKGLLIGYILFTNTQGSLASLRMIRESRSTVNLYEIQSMTKSGSSVPLVFTDASCWRWVSIGRTYLSVKTVGNRWLNASKMTLSSDKATWNLAPARVPKEGEIPALSGVLTLTQSDADHLIALGSLDGSPVEIHMKRLDVKDFPLMTRGFHWVNEYPYFR